MPAGRPTDYKPEYAEQAKKLCELGATDAEARSFFSVHRSEIEWLAACLRIIKEDRFGKDAARRATRSKSRNASLTPSKRVRASIASRISGSINGRKDGSLFSRLGYSIDDLRKHLESRFAVGMTWDNYGAWHIDHIKPCCLFDMTDQKQFEECWAFSNLQPLWASDNIKKGAKYGGS